MNILIKSVTVIDPNSAYHGKEIDLSIEDGIIQISSKKASVFNETINGKGLLISPGWFDMRVNFYDPGFEYREGIKNGALTSAAGGFTGVALLPETNPGITGKSQVEYIINQGRDNIVSIYPMGSILQESGETISEMYDLLHAGAIAFSSGYKGIADEGLLLRAMQYSSTMDVPLVLSTINKNLYGKGQMNEGLINVQIGMKGIPDVADEVEINKIISLCRYTNAKVHISGVSGIVALNLILKAQEEGLKITCDTTAHHLSFDENDLLNFNTQLKLRPPLRTQQDKIFLRNGVKNGTIQAVVSDHNPLEEDKKKCEFEIAGFGASGTQTVYSQLVKCLGDQEKIVSVLAIQPREILGLKIPVINDGEIANITLFDPEKKWILNEESNQSKSRNHPLWQQELSGKAIAIANNLQFRKLS